MENFILSVILKTYLSNQLPFVPFKIESLPLICRLRNIGFHKYKNRWAKRLGKKLWRFLFNISFYILNLSGQAEVSIQFLEQNRKFSFNARRLHFSRIYANQTYNLCEPELAILMGAFLTEDKVFYDIGSNWGYFSLYAATLPDYHGLIHAFEPVEETYLDLQDWVRQLGQERRVSCHKVALSNTDGVAQMGVLTEDSGLASLARAEDTDSENHEVETCRMDSLNLPNPDFIKLDVEGYEFEVIQGSLNTLLKSKPMIVFENWVSRKDPEHTLLPIRALLDHGYKLFVPMWWIGAPTNKMFWPISNYEFPNGPKQMAYVPFDIKKRFSLRDQINFFCCHEDRLSELGNKFIVLTHNDASLDV